MKKLTVGSYAPALLVVAFLMSGCAKSLQYWNQAIESFERGAKLEMSNHYADRLDVQGDLPADALPDFEGLAVTPAMDPAANADPETFYRKADEKISEALAAPAPLVKEGKLGNALTLKALTSWKTGQVEAARTNAMAALRELEASEEDSPRDKPLARAVPGLVALDIAYDSTHQYVQRLKSLSDGAPSADRAENEAVLEEGRRRYRKFISDETSEQSIVGAMFALQEAMSLAGDNADVRRFLLLCELAGLKNRYDFWAQLNNFAKRSRLKAADEELRLWLDGEEALYLEDRDIAMERLSELLGDDTRSRVYQFWDGIL